MLERSRSSWRGVFDTTFCDKICQFSPGTPASANNKTDHHDITEIFLKVALNTINLHLSDLALLITSKHGWKMSFLISIFHVEFYSFKD